MTRILKAAHIIGQSHDSIVRALTNYLKHEYADMDPIVTHYRQTRENEVCIGWDNVTADRLTQHEHFISGSQFIDVLCDELTNDEYYHLLALSQLLSPLYEAR